MIPRHQHQINLLNRAEQAIRAVHQGHPGGALLLLGISRLDFINWNLGFSGGEAVLDNIAQRLADLLPGEIVYSLWDGNFALMADGVDASQAMTIAQRLVALCSVPHRLGDAEIFCPPFVGVAMVRPDYADGAALLRDALFAMQDARKAHLGCAHLYDPKRKQQAEWTFHMENGLRAAFETGNQFHVVYQPLITLKADGGTHLHGFEALMRWTHPVWGAVPPDQFIPVSEECGLIMGLGNYVLWEACRQQVRWANATGRQVTMAVNLSPVQLMTNGIEETINDAIAETGIDPRYLKLEVTETALAADPLAVAEKLRRIRATGAAIGVDDFGSGYSSLGQLDLFGLDFMKVDKSLIQRLGPGGRQTELVRLTIGLAKHLSMTVIAEGIETEEQRNILIGLGADQGQGYLFSRPERPEQAGRWLTAQPCFPA